MSDKTLYLIQSSFQQTDSVLNQLERIYSTHDAVVLMGDAVLFVQDPRILNKQHVAVLENDAEILVDNLPTQIQKLSYDQFADLVLDFKRCIRLN
ncbi:MAG: DsrH/TusB family sulfur metabolism protein [Acinetobacter sp.]